MQDPNDEENLVNLKDWKTKKAEADREKARTAPRSAGGPKLPAGLGPKIALAGFFIVILYLAMPKGFLAAIMHSL